MKKMVRFSLAGLLLLVTIVAVWLGRVTNEVRKQKTAIASIRDNGGEVVEFKSKFQMVPTWLKAALGDDFFRGVTVVDFATNQGRRPGSFQLKASDEVLSQMSTLKDIENIELGYGYKVSDAGLEHLKSMKKLKTLYLYRTGVTGTGLKHLAKLPKLKSMSFSHSKLNDSGLRVLGEMSQLTWLRLDHTEITDAGLQHLNTLLNLSSVTLQGTQVTSDGVTKLRKALPNCEISFEEPPREVSDKLLFPANAKPTAAEIQEIFNSFRTPDGYRMVGVAKSDESGPGSPVTELLLSDVRITSRVLDSLIQNQLPGLRKLTLEGPEVNDELLKCIRELSLGRLTINRSEITDEALRQLAEMQSLEDLDLRNNNALTDAGMIHLESLRRLRSLKLGYTGATPEGVARLKKALPNCEVAW